MPPRHLNCDYSLKWEIMYLQAMWSMQNMERNNKVHMFLSNLSPRCRLSAILPRDHTYYTILNKDCPQKHVTCEISIFYNISGRIAVYSCTRPCSHLRQAQVNSRVCCRVISQVDLMPIGNFFSKIQDLS